MIGLFDSSHHDATRHFKGKLEETEKECASVGFGAISKSIETIIVLL